jgi:DNA-binding IclR family transcriptional regulator
MTKNGEMVKLVKSAIRTMQLFALFADKRRPLSLGELAEAMKAPKSSCHELVQTLIHLGYILAIDGGRSYYPSKRLLELTERIGEFNPIKERIQHELRRLRDSTGETVFIGRLQGTQVVYLEVFDGTHTVRYNAHAGDLKAIHASALGKALLADLDEATRDQLIAELKLTRFNEHTITKKRDLKENLVQGLRDGVQVTLGEHLADVMGLAVPISVQGYRMAIGMAGPIPRMQKNREAYVRALKAAAASITG